MICATRTIFKMSDSSTLQIHLNGQPRSTKPGTTLQTLLEEMSLTPDKVAVEVNKRLVRAADYGRELAEGDQVEVVTFVGGG